MSFAVIKTGGKQYKVAEGDVLMVEKLPVEKGKDLKFEQVLLIGDDKNEKLVIGDPFISGAFVLAKVAEQGKGKKKIVFKYTNKTRYRKKKGHRQPFTEVLISKINYK